MTDHLVLLYSRGEIARRVQEIAVAISAGKSFYRGRQLSAVRARSGNRREGRGTA